MIQAMNTLITSSVCVYLAIKVLPPSAAHSIMQY